MSYPEYHYDIVTALFREGRFLLTGEAPFLSLKDHTQFYSDFFRHSFGMELLITPEYAVLLSIREDDRFARAICIFMAVLCYELDREDGNLLVRLSTEHFRLAEWEERLPASSFRHLLRACRPLRSADSRHKFYRKLARRGVIELTDGYFRFTPAHRYFLEFARGVTVHSRGEEE